MKTINKVKKGDQYYLSDPNIIYEIIYITRSSYRCKYRNILGKWKSLSPRNITVLKNYIARNQITFITEELYQIF